MESTMEESGCLTCPSSDSSLNSSTPAADNYRPIERRYREKFSLTKPINEIFPDLIDFHQLSNNSQENSVKIQSINRRPDDGLPAESSIFSLIDVPGLFFIASAISLPDQLRWSNRCLKDFSNAAHTNLTNLYGAQSDHWSSSISLGSISPEFLRLRWSSLGFHYNWTHREYKKFDKSPFPSDLAEFATKLARSVGYELLAEAAIVNFYPSSGSMGAHLDSAELTQMPPIVSISLGNSAIFMIGGPTKSVKPSAILVRSGDVVVMGGSSRVSYHSVPRIIENSFKTKIENIRQENPKFETTKIISPTGEIEEISPLVVEYLSNHRINVNIRQMEDEISNFDSIGSALSRGAAPFEHQNPDKIRYPIRGMNVDQSSMSMMMREEGETEEKKENEEKSEI